jgi:hypothetical protein
MCFIVVTAVYILRATGKAIMGPVVNNEHLSLVMQVGMKDWLQAY